MEWLCHARDHDSTFLIVNKQKRVIYLEKYVDVFYRVYLKEWLTVILPSWSGRNRRAASISAYATICRVADKNTRYCRAASTRLCNISDNFSNYNTISSLLYRNLTKMFKLFFTSRLSYREYTKIRDLLKCYHFVISSLSVLLFCLLPKSVCLSQSSGSLYICESVNIQHKKTQWKLVLKFKRCNRGCRLQHWKHTENRAAVFAEGEYMRVHTNS